MTRVLVQLIYAVAALALTAGPGVAGTDAPRTPPITFWTPSRPPRVSYRIEYTIKLAEQASLQGKETIRFVNTTSGPIQTLALTWLRQEGATQTLVVTANGQPVDLAGPTKPFPQDFVLAEPVRHGESVTLEVEFGIRAPVPPEQMGELPLGDCYPQLWWGCDSHNDYEVKLSVPQEYAIVTSGRLDAKSGAYRQERAPSFGIWLGRDYEVLESRAGDVPVRCLYKSDDKQCAQLLVDTAVDVINFYRERFGFYPYPTLAIVPGDEEPMGGYPMTTSIIVIHGMGRMKDKPEIHWRWITAHEIGHQYWGRYVLDKGDPDWLWIGLGIYTDREYCRARKLSDESHRGLFARYINGAKKGLDTTVLRSQEEMAHVPANLDLNNVVIHGKGFAIISALDCVLGQETFGRICRRCLREFAGRRLGLSEFQSVCEQESGQDLGWFFDQWVNSNKCLSYEIASRSCDKKGDIYITQVQVKCLGSLKMPVPVQAEFEDGTSQQALTNRLHDVDTIRFESRAPLKQACLDPEQALAMVSAPPASNVP